MRIHKFIIWFTLATVLASCSWMPAPVRTQPSNTLVDAGLAQTANQSVSTQGTQKQTVTFPDSVTPQSMAYIDKLPKSDALNLRFIKKPISGQLPQGKDKIWMPQNQAFKVRFKAGAAFNILDNDASDGEAVIQMPSNQLREGFLRVNQPSTKGVVRSLKLADPLYYIQQELVRNAEGAGTTSTSSPNTNKSKKLEIKAVCSEEPDSYRVWEVSNSSTDAITYEWELEGTNIRGSEMAPPGISYFETETQAGANRLSLVIAGQKDQAKNSIPATCPDNQAAYAGKWLRLGVRQFPIPSDWYSTDQQDYVLNFTHQQVPTFQIKWLSTTQTQVDFPSGIKEIGPNGGSLELPGIIEMEVPIGALSQKTTLVIRQLSKVFGYFDADHVSGPDAIDVASPVEFFPHGLQFNTPAYVRFKTDLNKVKNYYPSAVEYVQFSGNPLDPYQAAERLQFHHLDTISNEEFYSYQSWFDLPHFSFLRLMVFPRTEGFGVLPSLWPFPEEQKPQPCPSNPNQPAQMPLYALHWDSSSGLSETELRHKIQSVCEALINSWIDFADIPQTIKPFRWREHEYNGVKYKAIPVFLKHLEGSAVAYNKSDNNYRSAELFIDPGPTYDNVIETSSHENYHAFQMANIKSPYGLNYELWNTWLFLGTKNQDNRPVAMSKSV